jgi:predicted nuclease with TOPRIM domain
LILAFIAWSVQMLVAYRIQVDRIQQQIDVAMANQGEVADQAEQHEAQAIEKKDMLKELEEKSEELASREKELKGQILGLKERTGGRSPTRHKVDAPNPAADDS